MDDKRKKIVAYLHPSIYLQDKFAQHYVESLPTQVRGDFTGKPLFAELHYPLLILVWLT